MKYVNGVGRTIGVLLFVQLILITAGFALLAPITVPSFLQEVAGTSAQIRTAVLLLTASSAVTVGIAVTGFPLFRQHSLAMAQWLLIFSAIWFAMQAIDNTHILSMLTLSERYAQDGSSHSDTYEVLATAMRSTRRFSHHTALLVIDIWFLALFALLFRSSLIPRALAGFGLLMVAIHLMGVALPPFVGYSSVSVLAYSLALSYLTIGTWLVVKGFGSRPT